MRKSLSRSIDWPSPPQCTSINPDTCYKTWPGELSKLFSFLSSEEAVDILSWHRWAGCHDPHVYLGMLSIPPTCWAIERTQRMLFIAKKSALEWLQSCYIHFKFIPHILWYNYEWDLNPAIYLGSPSRNFTWVTSHLTLVQLLQDWVWSITGTSQCTYQ